jgi:hypothetical protein
LKPNTNTENILACAQVALVQLIFDLYLVSLFGIGPTKTKQALGTISSTKLCTEI